MDLYFLIIVFIGLFPVLIFEYSYDPYTVEPSIDLGLENPTLTFTPSVLMNSSFCERVLIRRISVFNLKYYWSSRHIKIDVAQAGHEDDIRYCEYSDIFEANNLTHCQCGHNGWHTLEDGQWRSTIYSPFRRAYFAIKSNEDAPRAVTFTVKDEFQPRLLLSLVFGILLEIIAPRVSKLLLLYYISSMALGVFLVIFIIVYKGLEFLQVERENIYWLSAKAPMMILCINIVRHRDLLVGSIRVDYMLGTMLQGSVPFCLLGIFLSGMPLGYWIVWRFFRSRDGGVDADIAQFVEGLVRAIGFIFISESILEMVILISMVLLFICWVVSSIINSNYWLSESTTLVPIDSSRIHEARADISFITFTMLLSSNYPDLLSDINELPEAIAHGLEVDANQVHITQITGKDNSVIIRWTISPGGFADYISNTTRILSLLTEHHFLLPEKVKSCQIIEWNINPPLGRKKWQQDHWKVILAFSMGVMLCCWTSLVWNLGRGKPSAQAMLMPLDAAVPE